METTEELEMEDVELENQPAARIAQEQSWLAKNKSKSVSNQSEYASAKEFTCT